MSSILTSPSGRTLHHRTTRNTTAQVNTKTKVVKVKQDKERRLAENQEHLKNINVQAFLKAIAEAEGGGYDFMFGAVKGRKKDPWRFTDFSTHPGPGYHGSLCRWVIFGQQMKVYLIPIRLFSDG